MKENNLNFQVSLREIETDFKKFWEAEIYREISPEKIASHNEGTILFTNSAIVPFKRFIKGIDEIEDGVFVVQTCIRTQTLDIYEPEEWKLTRFKMLGVFSSEENKSIFFNQCISYLNKSLDIKGENLKIHIASDHDTLNQLATNSKLSERLVNDFHPHEYYTWTFGIERVIGKGATFFLDSGESNFKDLGNFIEIVDETGKTFFGFGMGIETLFWAKEGLKTMLDTNALLCFETQELLPLRFYDYLSAAFEIYFNGVRCANRGRGFVLKKLISRISKLATSCGRTSDDLLTLLTKYEKFEYGTNGFVSRGFVNEYEENSL